MFDKIILGARCRFKILRVTKDTIGSRERPKDTGIEDGSLLGFRMKHLVTIDTAIEAAVLTVCHLLQPEAQDVLLENILHFSFHISN